MLGDKKCILVADDEQKMVRALYDLLSAKGYNVICAYDGEEALDKFAMSSTEIDLVILDVMMPKIDGFEVAVEIRNLQSLVPIIMLTARGEEYDQLKGFANGVDDYISKPFSPSILLARIDALLRRVGKNTDSQISVGCLSIIPSQRNVYVNDIKVELTRREFELLYFLVINKEIIFTREQLLNNIWGFDYEGSLRTVDTHIKQLRIKLGEAASYIKTVHCVGYQFEVE
ncbi:response regulator transcription factor [Eubacterium sp.]|uniref:response regulator transcription factor n=1 Tax=Eubacterium sp. TaxID=142586 RepID=UPI003F094F3B